MFDDSIVSTAANTQPLNPARFVARNAVAFPSHDAVIHNGKRYSWAQVYQRCLQLGGALRSIIGKGPRTVAVISPNTPAMLEAHFGVPLSGNVLSRINCRLDARSIAYILNHSEAEVLVVDSEFSALASQAIELLPDGRQLTVRRPVLLWEFIESQHRLS